MSSEPQCPSEEFFGLPVSPVVGETSFHQLAIYIAGGCTILSCILCFGACFMHLFTYRNRHEQRQIARIVLTPAIISIFDFFGIRYFWASGFLKPLGEYYDAIALVSLYLLFITYATVPDRRSGPKALMENFPVLYAQHSYQNIKMNNQRTYYRTWFFVFQVVPVRFITMIASMIVYGTVCKQLSEDNKIHMLVSVITTVSTIVCFLGVVRMMNLIKPSLQGHQPVMKTVALKGLVAFSVIFELVMAILKSAGAINSSSTMSYIDWHIIFPRLVICGIALIFSVVIVIPFRTTPYTAAAMPGVKKMSPLKGLFDLLNFTDVLFLGVWCLGYAFKHWMKKPEEGTKVTYRKDFELLAESDQTTIPSPTYSRV